MTIKNILTFEDAADLIENCKPEVFACLSKDFIYIISSAGDFEALSFILVNDSQVLTVDSINGDVYSEDTIDEFISKCISYALDELKGD